MSTFSVVVIEMLIIHTSTDHRRRLFFNIEQTNANLFWYRGNLVLGFSVHDLLTFTLFLLIRCPQHLRFLVAATGVVFANICFLPYVIELPFFGAVCHL